MRVIHLLCDIVNRTGAFDRACDYLEQFGGDECDHVLRMLCVLMLICAALLLPYIQLSPRIGPIPFFFVILIDVSMVLWPTTAYYRTVDHHS